MTSEADTCGASGDLTSGACEGPQVSGKIERLFGSVRGLQDDVNAKGPAAQAHARTETAENITL